MAEPLRRQQAQTPRFLSVAEVACIFGVSDLTIYREIRCGRFPAIKFRGRYVVPARVVHAIEDAAMNSGALVDPSAWADVDEADSDVDLVDAARVTYAELDRPRPGANQFGAGSFSTQHAAGYGEDATPAARSARRGDVS